MRILNHWPEYRRRAVQVELAVQNTIDQHKGHFVICLAAFAILFFPEFSEYAMKPDDELAATRRNAEPWIAFGRWGAWLVHLVTERELNPYFSLLTFGVLIVASFLLFCRAAGIVPIPCILLSFALFAAFPIWHYLIEFRGYLLPFGCAVLFASLAGALFQARAPFSRPCFALFLILAVSMYQSAVFIALTIAVASFVSRQERTDGWKLLAFLMKVSLWTALAIVLYLAIWKFMMAAFAMEPKHVIGYLRPQSLIEFPGSVFAKAIEQAVSVYSGTKGISSGGFSFAGVLFVFGLLAFLLRFFDRSSPWRTSIFSLLVLAILLLMPFSLNLLSGGTLPLRSLIAVPFVYWFMVVIALQSEFAPIRWIAKALVLLVALQFIQFSSLYSFSHRFVAMHDQLVAGQVFQRIVAEVEDFDLKKTYPADFVGPLPFPNRAVYMRDVRGSMVTGASIFEWDAGNPHRANRFMGLLGMGSFRIIGQEERATIFNRVEAMPPWPALGSVHSIDGIVVVKFGDYPARIAEPLKHTLASGTAVSP